MKQLIGYGRDDHSNDSDADKAQAAWSVAILDDCEGCTGARVELVVEDVGRPGYGHIAHLAPGTVRQLSETLGRALKALGQRGG